MPKKKQSMFQNLIFKLIDQIIKKAKMVLVVAFALTLVFGYFMSQLKLDADLLTLLPEEKESVKNLNKLAKKFGGIGYVLIGIEMKNVAAAKRFAGDFSKEVEKLPDVRYVDYRIPKEFFEDRALLFMDLPDLWVIYNRLNKKIKLEKKLANPFYIDLLGEKYKLDFTDLEDKYKNKDDSKQSLKEYYISKNKQMLVIFIKPKFLSARLERAKQFIDSIKKIEKKINPQKYHPSIKVGYAGRYKKKIDESAVISQDLYVTSIVALILVTLIILGYFRKWSAIIIIGLPLVMGVVWSFGLAKLFIGHINIITGFLIAILMGLGIDFGIHFLNRYFEERRKGKSSYDAIHIMLSQTGRATLTAAVTTAAAFFVLLIAKFKGFSEFGLIAGLGIVSCYISMFTVLTALLVILEKMKWLTFVKKKKKKETKVKSVFKYNYLIIIISIMFLVFSINSISKIPFEYDFSKLQGTGLKSYALEKKIYKMFDISLSPSVVIAKDPIEEQKIFDAYDRRIKELNTIKKEYKKLSSIYLNLSKYPAKKIPSYKMNVYKRAYQVFKQKAVPKGQIKDSILINEYKNLAALYNKLNNYKDKIISIEMSKGLKKQGEILKVLIKDKGSTIDFVNSLCLYIPKQQNAKLKVMRKIGKLLKDESLKTVKGKEKSELNTLREKVAVGPITRANLPWETRRTFMGINKKSTEIFMLVFNGVDLSDGNNIKRYASEIVGLEILLNGQKKRVSASGETIIFNDILQLIAYEGLLILIISAFVVFLIVLLDFKKIGNTLLVLLPLMMGITWMLGLMFIFKIKFNFLNVIVLPIIIGIGIDHGVHVFHRYKEEGDSYIPYVIKHTGSAIFMSSITTMVGFSSLLWASHKGLNSVGQLALIGVGATFIVAVTVLPALLQLIEFLKKK